MTAEKISTAAEEIEAKFRTVWAPRKCDYPNTAFDIKNVSKDESWARFRIQTNFGNNGSLANVLGKQRFVRDGNVIIQLFFPLNKGVINPYDITETVVKAYQGKRTDSDVWFRNVRYNEIDKDVALAYGAANTSNWYQINVLADFTFDQIK